MVLWDEAGGGLGGRRDWGLTLWSLAGGLERSQRVPGHTSSFDIPDLEGGVSYTVKVTALIGNREGNPVSIVVTTRECWGGRQRPRMALDAPAPNTCPPAPQRRQPRCPLSAASRWQRPQSTACAWPGCRWRAAPGTAWSGAWQRVSVVGWHLRVSASPCTAPSHPSLPGAGGPQRTQQLPGTASSYDLVGLEPGRHYHISITSLAGSRESKPATVTAVTGKGLGGARRGLDRQRRAGAPRGTRGLGCPSLGLWQVMGGELGAG